MTFINILPIFLYWTTAPASVSAFVLSSSSYRLSSSSTPVSSCTSTTTFATIPSASDDVAVIAERDCDSGGTILDEPSMIAAQNFPIPPHELIEKAKYALVKDSGVLEPALWADDFEFCAPYVGPLSKEKFMEAAANFGIYDAFPDFDNRYFNFSVDPLEPGRVWYMTRLRATNSGTGLFGKEPNDTTVYLPPQAYSFLFNAQGLIRELTVGYPVDRRQGNTGGLGGMFGVFYGVGQPLPFPEGKPYQLSRRFRLLNKIGDIAGRFNKKN